jgi:hypothetical protein
MTLVNMNARRSSSERPRKASGPAHELDVFVDLLVDFYEQPCFIEPYNVVSQIPIVAH